MKQVPQSYPFYVYDVPNHTEVKQRILNGISSMGVHSLVEEDQRIANTDWHLSVNYLRPYYEELKNILSAHTQALNLEAKLPEAISLNLRNYWFQQYAEGDYHGWHIHENSIFSNVYYVNLPTGAAKTSFKVAGKEFEVEVAEGQILTFPSCFLHCSKPNQVGTKTVISFNY
jgi:hypothetical protein